MMGHDANIQTLMKNTVIIEIVTEESTLADVDTYFGVTGIYDKYIASGDTEDDRVWSKDDAPVSNTSTETYLNGWVFCESKDFPGVYGYIK